MREIAALLEHRNDAKKLRLIRFIKTADRGAVDVQNTDHLAAGMEGNHDFGIGRAVAGDMPREFVHVINALQHILLRRRTAYAAAQRNLDARWQTTEGTQHQRAFVHQVKAAPVDLWQRLPEQRSDIGKVCDGMGDAFRQRIRLLKDQRVACGFLRRIRDRKKNYGRK